MNLSKSYLPFTLLLALSFFLPSVVNAENIILKENLELVVGDDQTFTISFKDDILKKIEIKLVDDEETTLMYDFIEETGTLVKRYNLKKLPVGDYFLHIEDNLSFMTFPIKIVDGHLIIDSDYEQVFKPHVNIKENKLSINILCLQRSDVKISFKDYKNEVFFDDDIPTPMTVHKLYDLKELASGEYTVTIELQNRKFFEHVTVR